MTGSYQLSHNRRSIRLKGYDYTQAGAYFVTLVTYQRNEILGEIVGGEMQLSKEGPQGKGEASASHLIEHPESWREPRKGEAYANQFNEHPESWKAYASPQRKTANASPQHLWQRNYYEPIIRNEAEWQRIRDYIQLNLLRWQEDRLHSRAE